jgi:hypothetical protein
MRHLLIFSLGLIISVFAANTHKLLPILNHKLLSEENITIMTVRAYGQAYLQTKETVNDILVVNIALHSPPRNTKRIYSPWAFFIGRFEESCVDPMAAKFDRLCGEYLPIQQSKTKYPITIGAILILDSKTNDLHILLETMAEKEISSNAIFNVEYARRNQYIPFDNKVHVPPHVLVGPENYYEKGGISYIFWRNKFNYYDLCYDECWLEK